MQSNFEVFRQMLEARRQYLVDTVRTRWSITTSKRDEREMEVETADYQFVVAQMPVELHRTESALRRFETGEYGTCTDCNGEIDERRLRILPSVERCTSCQHRVEVTLHLERTWSRRPIYTT
ncbi:MAG: TraR/DksA C4-type zinc finger protein [Parcubacteria group bacterium]